MKKVLFLCLALVSLLASTAFAQNGGAAVNFSNSQRLSFTRSAPSVAPYAMTYQDSISILSSADTVRTNNINTSGWDFSGVAVGTTGTAVRAVAQIVFWVPTDYPMCVSADSLTFAVEPSFDNGQTYVSNTLTMALNAVGAHAIGNNAVSSNGATTIAAASGHPGQWYRGYLVADPDTQPLTASTNNYNIWGLRDFRLKIFGDAGCAATLRGAVYPLSVRR